MNVNLSHIWESPEQQEILDGLPSADFLERAMRQPRWRLPSKDSDRLYRKSDENGRRRIG